MPDQRPHLPMSKTPKPAPLPVTKPIWQCRACGYVNRNISDRPHCARCGEARLK